jgi:hypothetical protein
MKEEIRNLTIEEFWEKYSKNYENEEYETDSEYCKWARMSIGDFYEDGIDRDMLEYSDYRGFVVSKIEYFDEDGNYVDYEYSVCAGYEGGPVEYHPNTKMSDVFGAIYDEVKEEYLKLFKYIKSEIEDMDFGVKLYKDEDAFKMDFIELYADKLGIEYEYDYYYDMYITKIEKVWFNPPLE